MAFNPYEQITAQILANLEAGVAPWVKPWSATPGANLPLNYSTGKAYQGCNVVLLWMATHGRFGQPHFITYKQAEAMGGHVKKGEKACAHICRVIDMQGKETDDGKPGRAFKALKFFAVFNVEQCEGLPVRTFGEIKAPQNEGERDATIEEFIAATGANYAEAGDKAFYSPAGDFVRMPAFAAFKSAAHYYSTAFHELGHWTGSKARCDRDEGMASRFGTQAYAAEELVAELTSAFLCAEFSIDGNLQHAEYIGNWIALLKDDSRAFFTAASKAQQAADFLRRAVIAEPVKIAA